MYNDLGVPYVEYRINVRHIWAKCRVYGKGTGKIIINGQDLLYFEHPQEREQVLFPLQFTGLLGSVDIEAWTTKPPDQFFPENKRIRSHRIMGEAYGIRHALSLCLRSFTSDEYIERMRIGTYMITYLFRFLIRFFLQLDF